jgi:hypothetical protein
MSGFSTRAAVSSLFVLMLCSCAAQAPRPAGQAPALSANGKIDPRAVRAATPVQNGVDATTLLQEALRRELAERAVLWTSQPGSERSSSNASLS